MTEDRVPVEQGDDSTLVPVKIRRGTWKQARVVAAIRNYPSATEWLAHCVAEAFLEATQELAQFAEEQARETTRRKPRGAAARALLDPQVEEE
jgi:hypothetical protein